MFWPRLRASAPRFALGDPLDLFNRVFGESFGRGVAASFPAFNIWADGEGAIITSELPGVRLEDLEITASGNTIAVQGARKEGEAEGGSILRRERASGEFNRRIELPFQIDAAKVEAKLTNGVLRLTLPRSESDKPRKIAISSI